MTLYPEFIKYPKIHAFGHKENEGILEGVLLIEEKVDGANYRVMLNDEGKWVFGSRNCTLGKEGDKIGGNFERAVKWFLENVSRDKMVELERKFGKLILCLENCVKHTIDYDWSKIPPVLGYDVWSIRDERFLNQHDKTEVLTSLNIPSVPYITSGVWGKDILDNNLKNIPKSMFREGVAEGITIKNYDKLDEFGHQLMAKVIADEFKEVNHEAFGTSPKFCNNDTDKAVATWCTNHRVEKIIMKLIDEGVTHDMSMMMKLPKTMIDDIIAENSWEIIQSNLVIDFRKFRKRVATRCSIVLKNHMVNKVLNDGGRE